LRVRCVRTTPCVPTFRAAAFLRAWSLRHSDRTLSFTITSFICCVGAFYNKNLEKKKNSVQFMVRMPPEPEPDHFEPNRTEPNLTIPGTAPLMATNQVWCLHLVAASLASLSLRSVGPITKDRPVEVEHLVSPIFLVRPCNYEPKGVPCDVFPDPALPLACSLQHTSLKTTTHMSD
jgi:hypothetical protein